MRAGPAGYHRRAAPRGRPSQPRRTPYGATTRPAPLIPLAYLPPEEQDALQQLELEKSRQFHARSAAREAKSNIEQEERRIATLAQLNLQQAELDQKKALLRRTTRPTVTFGPPGTSETSTLTPRIPKMAINGPVEISTPKHQEATVFNGKQLSAKTAQHFKQLFGSSSSTVPGITPNFSIPVTTLDEQTELNPGVSANSDNSGDLDNMDFDATNVPT